MDEEGLWSELEMYREPSQDLLDNMCKAAADAERSLSIPQVAGMSEEQHLSMPLLGSIEISDIPLPEPVEQLHFEAKINTQINFVVEPENQAHAESSKPEENVMKLAGIEDSSTVDNQDHQEESCVQQAILETDEDEDGSSSSGTSDSEDENDDEDRVSKKTEDCASLDESDEENNEVEGSIPEEQQPSKFNDGDESDLDAFKPPKQPIKKTLIGSQFSPRKNASDPTPIELKISSAEAKLHKAQLKMKKDVEEITAHYKKREYNATLKLSRLSKQFDTKKTDYHTASKKAESDLQLWVDDSAKQQEFDIEAAALTAEEEAFKEKFMAFKKKSEDYKKHLAESTKNKETSKNNSKEAQSAMEKLRLAIGKTKKQAKELNEQHKATVTNVKQSDGASIAQLMDKIENLKRQHTAETEKNNSVTTGKTGKLAVTDAAENELKRKLPAPNSPKPGTSKMHLFKRLSPLPKTPNGRSASPDIFEEPAAKKQIVCLTGPESDSDDDNDSQPLQPLTQQINPNAESIYLNDQEGDDFTSIARQRSDDLRIAKKLRPEELPNVEVKYRDHEKSLKNLKKFILPLKKELGLKVKKEDKLGRISAEDMTLIRSVEQHGVNQHVSNKVDIRLAFYRVRDNFLFLKNAITEGLNLLKKRKALTARDMNNHAIDEYVKNKGTDSRMKNKPTGPKKVIEKMH